MVGCLFMPQAKKSCEFCDSTFSKNCDLEKHVKVNHGSAQMSYKCDVCDKEFYLEWRSKKHQKVHNGNVKFCHYFNNSKTCPYEEIGCMFWHKEAQFCSFKPCRNSMCQFRHAEQNEEHHGGQHEEHHDEQIETVEEEIEVTIEESPRDIKQCQLCLILMNPEDNLVDHMEMQHKEYFEGMMEATAEMTFRC